MSEPSQPTPQQHPFERFREAMKQLVKVPKSEVLKREAEYKKQRKTERKKAA